MKLTGRNLKQRLYGLGQLPSRVARARYFRGHGVHSPYVYSIVRHVFMRRDLNQDSKELYEALLSLGTPHRRAVQLQNLMHHCGYERFAINALPEGCPYAILGSELPDSETLRLNEEARLRHATLVIARPYACRERTELCRQIIEQHPCTTIDNRGYLIVFNNHLPKQHFRL